MKITLLPEDIVRRCLWDNYVYYVLGSEKEAQRILKENKEFELSERDALVIGLLKCIETTNLIHKFNTYIVDFLSNRSSNSGKLLLVKKKSLNIAVDKFLDKFPDYWIPSPSYKESLKDLVECINEFKDSVSELEVHEVTDQFGTHECVNSNSVKKILKFNYGF
jgi:hypothetical protein